MTIEIKLNEAPDWDIFKSHTGKFLSVCRPDYSAQVRNMQRFSCLHSYHNSGVLRKITFEEVDYIPPCIKYKQPSRVRFLNTYLSREKMVPLLVEIQSLLNADYKHFLSLHPVRYDKVKEAICNGKIDMPLVDICDDGFPRVSDGRHRIIALLKYGFSQVEVLVPENKKGEIIDLLFRLKNSGTRPKTKKFISVEETKKYTLADFTFSPDVSKSYTSRP